MSRRNTSEMAVMGLLALGARTGYDIRQDCEEKLSHFWSESFGQIYPVLKELNERGWLERDRIQEGGTKKYEHRLTEEGRAALESWIVEPPQPMRPRNELLLKLFLGRLVDREALLDILDGHSERVRERRELLIQIRDAIRAAREDLPDADYWEVTVDFGVRSIEAQLEWAAAAKRTLAPEAGS